MLNRKAELSDVPGMARLRANHWGSEEYWQERIPLYLTGQLHPQQALESRKGFVCVDGEEVVGLIAGHLTRRFGCDGELEWISVSPAYRGQDIASGVSYACSPTGSSPGVRGSFVSMSIPRMNLPASFTPPTGPTT
jgi:hypothetical protein